MNSKRIYYILIGPLGKMGPGIPTLEAAGASGQGGLEGPLLGAGRQRLLLGVEECNHVSCGHTPRTLL